MNFGECNDIQIYMNLQFLVYQQKFLQFKGLFRCQEWWEAQAQAFDLYDGWAIPASENTTSPQKIAEEGKCPLFQGNLGW